MASIIGLDVGTVRIGCAAADSKVRIPFPVGVWKRSGGEAEGELLRVLIERDASLLVVGLPLGPNGERTPTCDTIERFAQRIAKRSVVSIVYVDEAFSSLDALDQMGLPSDTKVPIDSFAACQILERYFDSLGNQ